VTFCLALEEVRAGDERRIGGKARSLLRLGAAGLRVPRAFAITTDLFHALRGDGPALPRAIEDEASAAVALEAARHVEAAPWPTSFLAELASALAALGAPTDARFAVRSSATLEDRADAVGAGIFLSRTNVTADEVPAAVRAVLAAALEPAALAYASRRGLPASDLEMAVLVHAFTPGDAAGTAAFEPGAQEQPLIDETGRASVRARETIAAAARALAGRLGTVEVEWVTTRDEVLFLQQRPYRAPARRAWSGASALADGAWRWDAAHNPLPLSPAQAGLVALVDSRCRTGLRQRVVGGYLFHASAPRATPTAEPAEALRALTREADARRAALGPEPSLEDAIEAFEGVYEPLFGVVQPATRAARDAMAAFLRAHGLGEALADLLRGVGSRASERRRRADAIAAAHEASERDAAIAAYLERFGDEAPTWDLATPTYAETPTVLLRLSREAARADAADDATADDAADARLAAALPLAARDEGRRLLAAARAAAAVAEDDDALYARAQTAVRHALLREGRRLQAENLLARADDVFWLPLETVRRSARGAETLTPAGVTHAIAAARADDARALGDPPPLPGARADDARTGDLRGRAASSGRAFGAVHIHVPGRAVPAGAVLVARALLPTELPLLEPVALVVETGGPLGHVAAQARERGLPAVVDAAGACAAFRTGDRVLVDGDAGIVVRIDS
jgi:phosphohistidine swiveling domain-containing protein